MLSLAKNYIYYPNFATGIITSLTVVDIVFELNKVTYSFCCLLDSSYGKEDKNIIILLIHAC